MAEEELSSLDDLDWSDVEGELQANREAILNEAKGDSSSTEAGDAETAGDADSSTGRKEGLRELGLDIDFLLDVQLNMTVEVGRCEMQIEELLELDQNSVIELGSAVGQPLDIRVNERLVARGEVVVINDKFAIRVTDIVSPNDRFAAL